MLADLFPDTKVSQHDPGGRTMLRLRPGVTGSAEFSDCQRYRYKLRRVWDGSLPVMAWCMMNPSTADAANVDDPTVAKCQRFARRLGFGGIWVGNSCAYRATDNRRLMEIEDPVGPRNIAAILEMAEASQMIVVAHGLLPGKLQRHADAMCWALLDAGHELNVLRQTASGAPGHPLFLPETTTPMPWAGPVTR
jgi:hypothetical protein